MKEQSPGIVLLALLVLGTVYTVITTATITVLSVNKSASVKRRWFPRCMTLTLAFLVFSAYVLSSISPDFRHEHLSPFQFSLLIALFGSFYCFMIIRNIKFCDSCGEDVGWESTTRRWTHCCECGRKMKEVPTGAAGSGRCL